MKSFLRHVQLFCELPFPYQESLVERTKEFVRKGKLNNISSIHNWIIKNSVASWAGNKAFTWRNIGCKSLMGAVYPAWIGARSIMKFAFDGVFIRLCGSFGIVINVLSLSTWTSALSNNKSWNRAMKVIFRVQCAGGESLNGSRLKALSLIGFELIHWRDETETYP